MTTLTQKGTLSATFISLAQVAAAGSSQPLTYNIFQDRNCLRPTCTSNQSGPWRGEIPRDLSDRGRDVGVLVLTLRLAYPLVVNCGP
jgi:hypothetical protein